MQTNIHLIRKGWKQYSIGETVAWVRGQAHLENQFLGTEVLSDKFAMVASQNGIAGLDGLVSALNGNWAAVVKSGEWVYLSTDHLRSIQILYRAEGDTLYAFDDMADFRKTHNLEFDECGVQEYISSGYVYSNRTLFKETYSLQAAERVAVMDGKIEARRYWRYIPNIDKPIVADDALVERIDKTFEASMRRLVESASGKRIVVPLSGGYDSRLIVNYLYKLGMKNVLCYTYGVKNNEESYYSKEIASRLGYEWHYVEYTAENRTALINDPSVDDCFRYMCNGTNRYCSQEHIALQTLRDKGVLNTSNDVIVPGYYFDYLAGSKVSLKANNLFAASEMCQWENNFFPKGHFLKSIRAVKAVFNENRDVPGLLFYEGWAWQERLAKFIINNVRDYEYLGFEWRLPLCDRELFALWLTLPYKLRKGRRYFYGIFPKIAAAEILDVGFNGRLNQSFAQKVKQCVGEMIPYILRFTVDRLVNKKVVYGGGTLASTQLNVRQLADSVAQRFSFCRERLSDFSNVSPNAAISLRGLAVEAGIKS